MLPPFLISLRTLSRLSGLVALFTALAAMPVRAADCESNFSSSGNFLFGRAFKTAAELPGIQPENALLGAQQYLSKEGWNIQQVDKTARIIVAWPAGTRPERPVPLNVTVEPSNNGAKLTLTLATPGGAFAMENSIQTEFCKITSAASSVSTLGSPSSVDTNHSYTAQVKDTSASTTPPQSVTAATNDNRLCLGKACLGMSIEEAADLPLLDNPKTVFSPSDNPNCNTCGQSFGLNAQNQRVWFKDGMSIDRKWIRQYSQAVKVLCSATFGRVEADMRANDSQLIHLLFRPVVVDGHGQFRLTSVRRNFPGPMSQSQRDLLKQQVHDRYGAAFYDPSTGAFWPKTPFASIQGSVLSLEMPFDVFPGLQLMEQPGCSVTARLD